MVNRSHINRWRWSAAVVAAVVVAAVAGVFLLRGRDEFQARIVGPSMAPTLLGRHGTVTCERCRFPFCFDLEETAAPRRIVCPNCGRVHDDHDEVPVRPGDEVTIDPASLQRGAPKRFDLVAFDVPDENEMLGVKRVIGMPGEEIAIRGGDIFIHGKILQKELPQQQALGVLVHDEDFAVEPRWIAAAPESQWRRTQTAGQTEFSRTRTDNPAQEDTDWVWYHHRQCYDSPANGQPGPILDNDPYNQTRSRQLNEVFDVRLECAIRWDGEGTLSFAAHDGWDVWRVELTESHVHLYYGESQSAFAKHALQFRPDKPKGVIFGLCDGQAVFSVDGAVLTSSILAEGKGTVERSANNRPLGFGARQCSVRVSKLKVFRDVYWLGADGLPGEWRANGPLRPLEYFVLGDNAPVSIDSRQFGPLRQLRGIVRDD